jgi:hypothetical protein
MRRNRTLLIAGTLAALVLSSARPLFSQASDWRSTAGTYFYNRDFLNASDYLRERLADVDASEKPVVIALLAFLSDRLGGKTQARDWMLQFFETYGGPNVSLPFLDIVSEGDVSAYLNSWRSRYPQVTNLTLVRRRNAAGPMPPGIVELGIEISGDAFYRFSDAGGIMGGGLLHKGFNILGIPADHFFDRSGAHVFALDLKQGEVLLRKELTVSVGLTPEEAPSVEKTLTQGLAMEYMLSFYFGDKLVVSSSKLGQAANPLKLDLQPTNLKANPLFKPPGQHDRFDPSMTGFSIPGAIGALAGLVKDLVTKKPQKIEPIVDRVGSYVLTYFRPGPGNTEVEVKATVTLQTRNVPAGR